MTAESQTYNMAVISVSDALEACGNSRVMKTYAEQMKLKGHSPEAIVSEVMKFVKHTRVIIK